MTPLRTLIVDDEEAARALMRRYVARRDDLVAIGEATTGRAAVESIRTLAPDLVLLDIEMPSLDGFGVVEARTPNDPPAPHIVFVTAYDRYAVRAFELQAVDYLLKPVTAERFDQAIDRCLARESRPAVEATRLQEDALRRPPQRILIRVRGRIVPVPVAAISHLESDGDYVRIVAGPERYLLEKTLTDMEGLLAPRGFVRIHRGTLVNVAKIRDLRPLGSGRYALRLVDGNELIVSRSHSAQFRGAWL